MLLVVFSRKRFTYRLPRSVEHVSEHTRLVLNFIARFSWEIRQRHIEFCGVGFCFNEKIIDSHRSNILPMAHRSEAQSVAEFPCGLLRRFSRSLSENA